jgi:colanic acid biosynthesis glycosyl transferase WcaI
VARVLLLSLVFAPDGVSTAQLMGELAADLQRAGHDLAVVTTTPHYNRDAIAEAAQPLARIWGGLAHRSTFHGIPVFHVTVGRKRGGFAGRMLGWLRFHVLGFVAALVAVPRPGVVLVPSPLLTAGVLGWLVARLRRAAFVYNVQELYPEFAVKVGQLKNPLVIRMLLALERFVYRRAAAVTVIGEGMRRAVVSKGVPAARVHLIPNFVDTAELAPRERDNAFRREVGLGDAFVVSYAGNMGYAQGLDALLEAAALLRGERDIVVLFVGGGVLRESLMREAEARGLSNVRFVPHQPYARVPEIYAASDACVVAMIGGMAAEAVPSKFLRIMACGRPVLAMTDPASDLAREVNEAGAGIVVAADRPDQIASAIRALRDDPARCRAAAAAGRRAAETRYARPIVTARYAALLAAAAERRVA